MKLVTVKLSDKSRLREPRGTMVTVNGRRGYETVRIEDVAVGDTINGKLVVGVQR